MEAIPLSETSATVCSKALTFTWISRFECLKQSLLIVGRNLLPAFGFNFAKCLISHKQTTAYHPESNGAVKRLH
jgi:hypothetical protein